MNYYKNLTEEYDDIEERYELIMERVRQIIHESLVKEPYRDYFSHVAGFIARIGDVLELVKNDALPDRSLDQLQAMNHGLYNDIWETTTIEAMQITDISWVSFQRITPVTKRR